MKHAFFLAMASIRARCMFSGLSALSVATAIAMLCVLHLLIQGMQDGIARNAGGVDVIVGAKGSKLQLVLSSIYHVDVPTGNIAEEHLEKLGKNPQVRSAIPVAMGDSFKGYRVIGTTADYLALYGADIAEGRVFDSPFDVVAGAATGIPIGETFIAVHGFSAEGHDAHDFHAYEVVGVMKPTGTVIDRLLLTPVKSVQALHAHHEDHDEDHDHHDEDEGLAGQITAILLKVKSPTAVLNLPRQINGQDDLVAASPAYEMARLSAGFGAGKDVMFTISVLILVLSILMLFSTLASGLAGRRYDLAVLRVLGASRETLFATILFEGVLIGTAGAAAGVLIGHGAAFLIASQVGFMQGFILPQNLLGLQMYDAILLLAGTVTGALAALLPAISALKLDITGLLASKI